MAIAVFEEAHDGQERGFGALETPEGALPLAALEVRALVTGLSATTRVRQRFVNTHDRAIEATYVFPLPDRGAVRDFRLRVAGREVVGELKERGQARQEYAQAIASGHRAAIAEEERPDVFTMRVGNLPPGEEAVVELELIAPLDYVAGEAEWRFPLVVAPRYVPGNPLPGPNVGEGVAHDTDAAPDASRVTPPTLLPGFPNPVALTIEVTVDAAHLEHSDLRATLHAHEVERLGRLATLRVAPGERVDRDFVMRFQVGDASSIHAAASRSATPDGRAAFELVLAPPTDVVASRKPRDVVFVLDRSGSMGGWKMVAARRAVGRMLDTLGREDRFNVLAFDNVMETMPEGDTRALTPATNRLRWRALEYLSKLEARGGTQMLESLQAAARQLQSSEAGRERAIVLVTDGQIANEDQVLRSLSADLKDTRVYTVGIDRAVNAGFLNRLAALGGGFCELIEGEDRLDEVMDRVHMAIEPPALTELTFEGVDGARIEARTTIPNRAPALFTGMPLVVRGLLADDSAGGAIVVRGAHRDGSRFERLVPLATVDSPAPGALWGRAQVRALEDQYVVSPSDHLEQQIVRTSLTHKVLCRFTSFVAVDREETIERDEPLKQVVQPVEAPSGWKGGPAPAPPSGGFGMQAPGAPPMPSAPAPVGNRGGRKRRATLAKAKEMRAEAQKQIQSKISSLQDTQSFDSFSRMDAKFEQIDAMSMEDAEEDLSALKEKMGMPSDAPAPPAQQPTLGRVDTSRTQAGAIQGDARVLSPEAARGTTLDARADVWTLAALLFRVLTGQRLFDAPSDFAAISAIVTDGVDLGRFTQLLADAGFAGFAAALLPALQSDKAARWADLALFADALDAQLPALGAPAGAHGSLAELSARGQRADAARLVRDAARALHASGVVHGALTADLLQRAASGAADVLRAQGDGTFTTVASLPGAPQPPEPPKKRRSFWK
jgi:Ca-activated chloride channel family protein